VEKNQAYQRSPRRRIQQDFFVSGLQKGAADFDVKRRDSDRQSVTPTDFRSSSLGIANSPQLTPLRAFIHTVPQFWMGDYVVFSHPVSARQVSGRVLSLFLLTDWAESIF
jgi:hypothetical protein